MLYIVFTTPYPSRLYHTESVKHLQHRTTLKLYRNNFDGKQLIHIGKLLIIELIVIDNEKAVFKYRLHTMFDDTPVNKSKHKSRHRPQPTY